MGQFNVDDVFRVYNARLEECKKAKEHCATVIKTQKLIIKEIKKGYGTIGKSLTQYLDINQQILADLSCIIYKNERDHAIMIALLMSNNKEKITSEEVLNKLLQTYKQGEQNIHIKTGRDAHVSEAHGDINQGN